MKISAILRCMGYVFAWMILFQLIYALCQNTTVTMAGSIVTMGALSFYAVRKNGYTIFSRGEKLKRQMVLSLLTGVGLAFLTWFPLCCIFWEGVLKPCWRRSLRSISCFFF